MFEISICIPTFNQPDMLKQTLDSLLLQENEDVQVVIHDGNYDDKNQEVVSKFTGLLNIEYVNKPGRSVDTALLDLLEMSSGKYIWWFGDDVFNQGALKETLKCIKNNYDCIYVNASIADSNKLLLNIDNEITSDKNLFLKLIGINIGFISSFIFLRSVAVSHIDIVKNHMIEEARSVPAPTFSNVYILLYVISRGSNFLLHSTPLFICHPNAPDQFLETKVKDSGVILNDAFFVFGVNMKDILLRYQDQFDKNTVKSLINASFRSAWRGVIVGAALGWDTTKGFGNFSKRLSLIKHYYNQPEILFALPLFMLPSAILRYLYVVYEKLKIKL
jgi:glycosyltransferase involved in cell wall biosynthesis